MKLTEVSFGLKPKAIVRVGIMVEIVTLPI
jgi:hypothetical protein